MKTSVNTVSICPEPSPCPLPSDVSLVKESVPPKTPNMHPLAALGSKGASEKFKFVNKKNINPI